MTSRKEFWTLFVVFSSVIILSNVFTAKYIGDKVNNNIRMELEGLKSQMRQIQPNVSYSHAIPEEKWNDVMAPTELAKYLDIELDQVYDIIDDKESEIPYVLIEGAYRFSKDGIDKWLTSRKSIIVNTIVY